MEMTINELIKEMEEEYTVFLEGTGLDNPSYMEKERKNNADCDKVCTANEMTLNILRKYQKIQQILNEDYYKDLQYSETLRKISEVVEDGND